MRKILSIVLALITVCCMSALVACGKHEHAYDASKWETDATSHWHVCTGEDCAEVGDKAEHSFVSKTDNDKHWQECSVCGFKKDEANHTLETKTSAEKHWQECACGVKKDEANHTWGAWAATPAGYGVNAGATRSCFVCGQVETKSFEKTSCEYTGDFVMTNLLFEKYGSAGLVKVSGYIAQGSVKKGDSLKVDGYEGSLSVKNLTSEYDSTGAGYGDGNDDGKITLIFNEIVADKLEQLNKAKFITKSNDNVNTYDLLTIALVAEQNIYSSYSYNIELFDDTLTVNTEIDEILNSSSEDEVKQGEAAIIRFELECYVPTWVGMEVVAKDGDGNIVFKGIITAVSIGA